jgi:glycosyltransferase involved in cell wall biosynthesis
MNDGRRDHDRRQPVKLSVVIPVYNEERTISEVIRRVAAVDIGAVEREIVVVDDGSSDATPDILRRTPGVTARFHPRNLGKGAALSTGIRVATGDIVIFQDADLEYDPTDFKALIGPILAGETEFVMGSRFLLERPKFFGSGKSPLLSHYIGNKLVTWVTNALYGNHATDYEGCYKAVTRRLLLSLGPEAPGFDFDNELICKALRRHHRILEVPIRYTPRSYREGKKVTWRHGVSMLATVIKWRFRRL